MSYFHCIEIVMIFGSILIHRRWKTSGRPATETSAIWIATFAILIIGNGIELSLKDGEIHRIWLATSGLLIWGAIISFISRFEIERRAASIPLLNPNPVLGISLRDFSILFANKAALEIFTVDGKLLNEIRDQFAIFAKNIDSQTEKFAGELTCGKEVFSIYIVPAANNEYQVYCQNITQLVAIKYSLNAERLKSSSVDSMAALGEATAGICHDMANPLSIISLSIQALQKKFPVGRTVDDRFIESLNKMELAAERANKIMRSTLKFVRNGEEDEKKCKDVLALLEEAMQLCHSRAVNNGVNAKFEPKIETKDIVVGISDTHLLRVIMNLISNGIDAVAGKTESWVVVTTEINTHTLAIKVTDSGKGIPLHLQSQMFQPLFTTKPEGKGTGLGLTLCRRLISEAKGNIYLNTENPNTQFVVEIPIISGPANQLQKIA